MSLLKGLALGILAFDLLSNASKEVGTAVSGAQGKKGRRGNGVGRGPVESSDADGVRRIENHKVANIEQRCALIREQMIKGSYDPKVISMARRLVTERCGDDWCIAPKDYKGEAARLMKAAQSRKAATALFEMTRRNLRYTRDHATRDQFSTTQLMRRLPAADCFTKGTLVLRDDFKMVPIETLQVGNRIWGHTRWSRVVNVWERGTRATWKITLNNGGVIRLTPEHKVWIKQCPRHPDRCHNYRDSACNGTHCDQTDWNIVRIPVSELKPGHKVIRPDKIESGTDSMDPGVAYVEGLYLSDGWSQTREPGEGKSNFSISGKDGFPKEAQKREVEEICRRLGAPTRWHPRYITVKDEVWAERLALMGKHAPQKHLLNLAWDEATGRELVRGILADAGMNTNGTSWTFTSTSRELMLQLRVLLKMQGVSGSTRYVEKHGGLGKNPIWRLTNYGATSREPKALRVKSIEKDNVEFDTFDIETDDHFVWLPEADWTVSQCDDMVTWLGAHLLAIGFCPEMVVIQSTQSSSWDHIYISVTLDNNTKLHLDPTEPHPAGWEVPKSMIVKKKYIPVCPV